MKAVGVVEEKAEDDDENCEFHKLKDKGERIKGKVCFYKKVR